MKRRSFLKGTAVAATALAVPVSLSSEEPGKVQRPLRPEDFHLPLVPGSKAYIVDQLKTVAGCRDAWIDEPGGPGDVEIHTVGGDTRLIGQVIIDTKPVGATTLGERVTYGLTCTDMRATVRFTPH